MKTLNLVTSVIAIIALLVGGTAYLQTQQVKNIALSDVIVEEQDALCLPVLDQSTNTYGYISIYELAVSNQSGPDVVLSKVEKVTSGFEFIVALNDKEIVDADLQPVAFISEVSIAEIRNNPRILKDLMKSDIGDAAEVDLAVKAGGTKKIVIGIAVQPYADGNALKANFVLASFRLVFNNGKTHVFRRGFPILPIQ